MDTRACRGAGEEIGGADATSCVEQAAHCPGLGPVLPPKQRRFWFQPKVKLPGTEFPAWELQSASKGKAVWLQEQMVRVRPPRSALWLPALTPCPGHPDVGARVCTLMEKGPGWVWGGEPSGRQLWYTETQGRTQTYTETHTHLSSAWGPQPPTLTSSVEGKRKTTQVWHPGT